MLCKIDYLCYNLPGGIKMSKDVRLATKKWKNFIKDADEPIDAELKKLEELKLSMLNPANWFGKKQDDSLYKPYMTPDWVGSAVQDRDGFNFKKRPAIFQAFVDFWHGDDPDHLKKLASHPTIPEREGKKILEYVENGDLESAFQLVKIERWNNFQDLDIEEGVNTFYQIEDLFRSLESFRDDFSDSTLRPHTGQMIQFEKIARSACRFVSYECSAAKEHLKTVKKIFIEYENWLEKYEKNLSDYRSLNASYLEDMLPELEAMNEAWSLTRDVSERDPLYNFKQYDKGEPERIAYLGEPLRRRVGVLSKKGVESFEKYTGASLD